MKKAFPEEWIEKIYAGWLAKVIGIRLGVPVEGWSKNRIEETYGAKDGYLEDFGGKRFAADDDSNGPLFFVRAISDSEKTPEELTSEDVAEAVLNYVPVEHGFFWWGGYGASTEHTAYQNLRAGIPAPESGSIAQNGSMVAEQIGGQIFIDTWGLITPGNPDLAAELAGKAAAVTHGGEGVYGGQFVAACISYAFVERDIRKILEKGFSYLPQESLYRQVGEEVMAFYDSHPENWEDCYDYIYEHHREDSYPGSCHIIPNSALMILALLYGEGDFTNTLQICNRCGWDTDCNVGNIASIMGVRCGLAGIDPSWRKPINDFLATASVMGSINNTDIASNADYLVRQAAKIRGEVLPEAYSCCKEEKTLNCHFAYEGSTHGLEACAGVSAREKLLVQNSDRFGTGRKRCLQVEVPGTLKTQMRSDIPEKPNTGNEADAICIFRRTYLFPKDFADNRYCPAFSPVVYPGQTLRAAVTAEKPVEDMFSNMIEDMTAHITAKLYVYCQRENRYYYGEEKQITPGEWTDLSFQIPAMSDLITEVGVQIQGCRQMTRISRVAASTKVAFLNIYLRELLAEGTADYAIDFAKEQVENWSFAQKEVSQFTRLKGHLFCEKKELHLTCSDYGEAYTGGWEWRDYKVTAQICPLSGEHHYLALRVQGGVRSYLAGLGPAGKLYIWKNTRQGLICLGQTDFVWRQGENYLLRAEVKKNQISVIVDEVRLSVTDTDHPYLYGCIGYAVRQASHLKSGRLTVKPI